LNATEKGRKERGILKASGRKQNSSGKITCFRNQNLCFDDTLTNLSPSRVLAAAYTLAEEECGLQPATTPKTIP